MSSAQRALLREMGDKKNSGRSSTEDRNVNIAIYSFALLMGFIGLSYGAVPAYQAFCQATGYGGTTQVATEERFKTMRPVAGARPIQISFNADTSDNMPWKFTPQ